MSDRRYQYFAISAGVVFFDQFTKSLARDHLTHTGIIRVFDTDLLWLFYTENPGSAFGMTFLPPVVLATISAVATLVLGIYLFRSPSQDLKTKLPLALILGGAAGNMVDRIVVGRVTDFISVDFPDFIFYRFPTFNIADSAISVGITILLIITLVEDFRGKSSRNTKSTGDIGVDTH